MRSLRRGVVDLAFIDGMHLFEYALRDVFHTERHTRWTSVMVLDDMLPRSVDEAARDRHTDAWTGDVFKVAADPGGVPPRPALRRGRHRARPASWSSSVPTPRSRVLSRRLRRIYAKYVVPDPQQVPQDILTRRARRRPRGVPGRGLLARAHPRPRPGLRRGGGFEQLRPKIEAAVRDASAPAPPVAAAPG